MTQELDAGFVAVEFDRWVEAQDLLLDPETMSDDERRAYDKNRARIERAMARGHLVITDDGLAQYTPYHPNSRCKDVLTFHERGADTVLATDGKKRNQDAARGYAAMASCCKVHPGQIAGLKGEDIKVCEALFGFLAD
jgi:hypothetical protein